MASGPERRWNSMLQRLTASFDSYLPMTRIFCASKVRHLSVNQTSRSLSAPPFNPPVSNAVTVFTNVHVSRRINSVVHCSIRIDDDHRCKNGES